jgi:hypothetical protein
MAVYVVRWKESLGHPGWERARGFVVVAPDLVAARSVVQGRLKQETSNLEERHCWRDFNFRLVQDQGSRIVLEDNTGA